MTYFKAIFVALQALDLVFLVKMVDDLHLL